MKIQDVVIVLVRPKAPGNIGSAARAIKVMGLGELRLVEPQTDHVSLDTRWLAYGSEKILEDARLFDDIASALAACSGQVATTPRAGRPREGSATIPTSASTRSRPWPSG